MLSLAKCAAILNRYDYKIDNDTLKELRDYLVNAMRPFIFTTGLPPVVLSWTLFVLEHIADMDEQRRRVRENGIALRK